MWLCGVYFAVIEGLNPGVVDRSEEESSVYISKWAVGALFSQDGPGL